MKKHKDLNLTNETWHNLYPLPLWTFTPYVTCATRTHLLCYRKYTTSEPEKCVSVSTHKLHRVMAMWSSFHEATEKHKTTTMRLISKGLNYGLKIWHLMISVPLPFDWSSSPRPLYWGSYVLLAFYSTLIRKPIKLHWRKVIFLISRCHV